MIAVLILIFVAVGLAAASFVVIPLLRARVILGEKRRRFWLPLGAGMGVMGIGLGIYTLLGQPNIALSSLSPPRSNDYPALIAALARRMPELPNDLRGWTLLGRGYLDLGNPEQADKALAHAISIARTETGNAPAALYSSYGEALAQENGEVTADAENAFRAALAEDPEDMTARYYLGFALVARGDKDGALALWEPLLAEAPPDAPWRSQLVNQVAALKANSGGAAPDPRAMMAKQERDLAANPNDLAGWERLIRGYKTLGEPEKAASALAKARTVFAGNTQATAALAEIAKGIDIN